MGGSMFLSEHGVCSTTDNDAVMRDDAMLLLPLLQLTDVS